MIQFAQFDPTYHHKHSPCIGYSRSRDAVHPQLQDEINICNITKNKGTQEVICLFEVGSKMPSGPACKVNTLKACMQSTPKVVADRTLWLWQLHMQLVNN